jgi:hypothetical protein
MSGGRSSTTSSKLREGTITRESAAQRLEREGTAKRESAAQRLKQDSGVKREITARREGVVKRENTAQRLEHLLQPADYGHERLMSLQPNEYLELVEPNPICDTG